MTIQIDKPEPCLRKVRKRAKAPWLPARIHRTCMCTVNGGDESAPHPWRDSCDRYPHLMGEVNGEPTDDIERIWTAREKIEQHQFDFLTALRIHIEEHEPNAADADPYKPVDVGELDPIF